jgi:NlpC/P60 family
VTRRSIFVAVCLLSASAALGQNIRPTSREAPGPRPIAGAEGREILATISTMTAEVRSEFETDCSHLVHDIYKRAGFRYDYVDSHELYTGSTNFTRVRVPQAGDLVVWRGHVGIVIDPQEHSFFSFVRSGPDTQFYDSPYWRSRGIARFFRYVTEKPLHAGRTLEAAGRPDHQPPQGDSRYAENPARPATVETPREIVFKVTGKNPSREEVLAAFVEMNRDSGESLRMRSLTSPGKSIIIYRELRVSAVQMKGKRGTAFVQIASLGALGDTQTGSPLRSREQALGFEKTKRGWVVNATKDAAYVKREVAFEVLSARLADLAKNIDATPQQERDEREIMRLLNSLVPDDSSTASAQSN